MCIAVWRGLTHFTPSLTTPCTALQGIVAVGPSCPFQLSSHHWRRKPSNVVQLVHPSSALPLSTFEVWWYETQSLKVCRGFDPYSIAPPTQQHFHFCERIKQFPKYCSSLSFEKERSWKLGLCQKKRQKHATSSIVQESISSMRHYCFCRQLWLSGVKKCKESEFDVNLVEKKQKFWKTLEKPKKCASRSITKTILRILWSCSNRIGACTCFCHAVDSRYKRNHNAHSCLGFILTQWILLKRALACRGTHVWAFIS